ncbi:sulfate transporter-like [Plakobranchus ocellatus]|uniref:Sulfate transporter-like n=1 Tax=Plakobranchus ocellatus TaxID=259542 RepID=A0AAV4AC36_9GAST|nr:sulfate transporter-like [Plakobranchus ocellatus]
MEKTENTPTPTAVSSSHTTEVEDAPLQAAPESSTTHSPTNILNFFPKDALRSSLSSATDAPEASPYTVDVDSTQGSELQDDFATPAAPPHTSNLEVLHSSVLQELFSVASDSSVAKDTGRFDGGGREERPVRILSFKLADEPPEPKAQVKRNAYTYDDIERIYLRLEQEKQPPQPLTWDKLFPVLGYVKEYNYRTDLMPDLVSGLSVAWLHMPQGLAFGFLANLTPISGVYACMFSALVYVVFGTIPHMSMGTNAMLSLITADMVEREADRYIARYYKESDPPDSSSEERMDVKLNVAMTSTFICGIILALMGVLRMGFLTYYVPSSFINGFTSAVALHMVLSQVNAVTNRRLT